MVELIFIRHARTAQNAAKRFQGHSDTELDALGRRQAQRIAGRMRDSDVVAVYTSDLRRAVQTAQPIADALGVELARRDDLREIDVGTALGMSKAELQDHHPELFAADWHRIPFPGGESYDAMAERISGAAREIARRHEDRRVVLVTHGGTIRAAIAGLAGIPITALAGLFVMNTSISRLTLDGDRTARLLVLNDTAHLEGWTDELLTPA